MDALPEVYTIAEPLYTQWTENRYQKLKKTNMSRNTIIVATTSLYIITPIKRVRKSEEVHYCLSPVGSRGVEVMVEGVGSMALLCNPMGL